MNYETTGFQGWFGKPCTPTEIRIRYSIALGAPGDYVIQAEDAPDGYFFDSQYCEIIGAVEGIEVPTEWIWYTVADNCYRIHLPEDKTGSRLRITELYLLGEDPWDELES